MEIAVIIFTWVVKVASTSVALYNFARIIAMAIWRKDCA